MDYSLTINQTEEFVKRKMGADSTGHDWFHVDRVRKNALSIWKSEQKGDPFIIEMSALLHDIPDEKLNGSKEEGQQILLQFLNQLELSTDITEKIIEVINSISFRGGEKRVLTSWEAKIVQDADRLDAIGAIGIARAFAYGGKKGQPIYHPERKVREEMTVEEYRNGKSSSVNHFYEKLLLLKDLLNTETAKTIAENRHHYMEEFLSQFYQEWNGQA
ncbi:HD domain-containing protein [Neobacillus sp. D3-1R]|uniref:HD domain-containing protein n=1 Tax=Neobacillus sp. D3-1R TaxID=3445778 RepID=UPI003F9F1846